MRHAIIGLQLILCAFSSPVVATPSPATWRREILLGTSDASYFTYLMERDYPPTYYAYTDSLFLLRYSLATGELEEKRLLRKTRHVDEAADGRWKAVEEAVAPFSTDAYLLRERMEPAFPADGHPAERSRGGHDLEVTPRGIFLSDGRKRAVLMDEEALRRRFGESGPDEPVIVERFEERGRLFLVVRSGKACSDMDLWQIVCKIDDASVKKAAESLESRGEAPRPPTERGDDAPTLALAGGVFVVREGDTLIKIAREVYGETAFYRLILLANPGVEPTRLKIGQVLKIPAVEADGQRRSPPAEGGSPDSGGGRPDAEHRRAPPRPPPRVTLEEVRAFFEPRDRDLDLVPLWRRLEILPRGSMEGRKVALPFEYQKAFEYQKDSDSCVLRRERWNVSVFPPDTDRRAQEAREEGR